LRFANATACTRLICRKSRRRKSASTIGASIPRDLEDDVDLVRIECGERFVAPEREELRPILHRPAFAQDLERERSRAAAFHPDGHPRSRELRQTVGLGSRSR
jgi:hypothetical protein